VTVIGHAQIVDDDAVIERWHRQKAPRATTVKSGAFTEEEFLERAWTPNRRLFQIVPEKFIGSDLRTLT
jgi:hypothetical protein